LVAKPRTGLNSSPVTKSGLTLPSAPRKDFRRNFIQVAVCELRFPIVLELESKPPARLHSQIRQSYPNYEVRTSLTIEPQSETREPVYTFSSREKIWTIAIRPYAIALETRNYTSFTDFMKRMKALIVPAAKEFDTEMYTRVGLRFIDHIPFNGDPVNSWVKEDLVRSVTDSHLQPESFWQVIQGKASKGKYTYQHGIHPQQSGTYVLDFDFYKEDVDLDVTERLIKDLHEQSRDLFFWSLGQKSLDFMASEG